MAGRPAAMAERDEGIVVAGGPAPGGDLGVDVGRAAEEGDRLVDEVGAEVEQDAAAALGGEGLPPPLRRGLRPPAPSASSRRNVSWSLSQRRLWKAVSGAPASLARSTSSSASATVPANGLSTTTATPHSIAAVVTSTWAVLGTDTTSRSGRSSSASSRRATTRAAGCSDSTSLRRRSSEVTTVATESPGVAAISGAWKNRPDRP
jgi:hypothetical protein